MLSKALILKRQAYQWKCNFHFERCLLWKRKNKTIFHRRDLSWGHQKRCEWWSSFSALLSQQAFSAWKFLLPRHFFLSAIVPSDMKRARRSSDVTSLYSCTSQKGQFPKMCYASANLLCWKTKPVQKLQELRLLKKSRKIPPPPKSPRTRRSQCQSRNGLILANTTIQ